MLEQLQYYLQYFFAVARPIGFGIFGYHLFKHRDMMRTQWKDVAGFMAFMALISFIRFSLADLDFRSNPSSLQQYTSSPASQLVPISFLMVFWEDSFFALPIQYIQKYLKKYLAIPLIILLSVVFGLGHLYQGLFVVFLTALLPYFIFHKMGHKYGFGTSMMCHILYDYTTFYTVKLIPFLM